MKKKLILAGGLVFIMFAIIIITSLFSHKETACLTLVHHIEKADTEKSYALLSSTAQAGITKANWTTTVKQLRDYYRESEPVLKNSVQTTDVINNLPQTKEDYAIDTPSGHYVATCYIAQDGKSIDAFSSQAVLQ